MDKKYKVGFTQGVYDMFHVGHLNLLINAKKHCEKLVVGINSDDLVLQYKHKESFIKENDVHIGIITVPAQFAQEVCDKLVEAGVQAVWNFAPTILKDKEGIIIQTENMASSLAVLSRHLESKK